MKKKIGIFLLMGMMLFSASTSVFASEAEEPTDTSNQAEKLAEVSLESGSEESEVKEEEEQAIEKIEAGEAVMLMTASSEVETSFASARSAKPTVTLTVGEKIYYGGWETSKFYINGNLGYCLEPRKGTPADGNYAATILEKNELLSKALYYLVGGPGYNSTLEQAFFGGSNGDMNYCYSHVVLSYIYDGCSTAGDAFTGVSSSVKQGCIDITNAIKNLPEPPAADLKITPVSQKAYYNEEQDYQQTDVFVLSGDSRNSVTLTVPTDVKLHNQSTGKIATGKVTVKGGEQFFFTAPTKVTGTWNTGSVYGTVTNDYKAIVFNKDSSTQTIGSWSYTLGEGIAPVSLSVKWLDYGKILLQKVSGDESATADGIDDSYPF